MKQGLIRKRTLLAGGGFHDDIYRLGKDGLERLKYVTIDGIKSLIPVATKTLKDGVEFLGNKISGMGISQKPKPSSSAILREINKSLHMKGGCVKSF